LCIDFYWSSGHRSLATESVIANTAPLVIEQTKRSRDPQLAAMKAGHVELYACVAFYHQWNRGLHGE
jgi:hypothetical protein